MNQQVPASPPVFGTPPAGDMAASIEPMILILGGVMTLVVGIFLIWLIRQMLREDRQAKASGEFDRRDGA